MTAATEAARRFATGCGECSFFAQPAQNPLVRNHALFVVSTLDRIPPPFWTVAVPKTGDPLILDARHPADWNRMIVSERPPLRSDADVEAYVKAFLDLAVGRALFVPNPLPAEVAKITKPGEKPLAAPLQVVRDDELLTVSFYAKEITGELKRWRLLLQSDGTVN